MGNGETPSYGDLIHMMDVAEDEIEENADQIKERTNIMLEKGNCRDFCESNGPVKVGIITRIRRKLNGIEQ